MKRILLLLVVSVVDPYLEYHYVEDHQLELESRTVIPAIPVRIEFAV
jgi:hypothetical protein